MRHKKALFYRFNKIFEFGTPIALYSSMGNENFGEKIMQNSIEATFTIETVYTTDCCGEYCSDDTQICTACGEHCEVVTENLEIAS